MNSIVKKLDAAFDAVEKRRLSRSYDLKEKSPEERHRLLYSKIIQWVCSMSGDEFSQFMTDIEISRSPANDPGGLLLSPRSDAEER